MFGKYTGNGLHIVLLAGALVFLLFFHKNNKIKNIVCAYPVLFAIVYAGPFTAEVIIKYFIGRSVYWRMFWALPTVLIMAYAFACFVERFSKKTFKIAAFGSLTALIVVTGAFVFTKYDFEATANLFKLPAEVPTVCQVISEDAGKMDRVKAVVPNDLLCYIRQYDASIYMPYGRNALWDNDMTDNERDLFYQMSTENPDYIYLDTLLKEEACTHIVWEGGVEYDGPFEELGYSLINTVEQYRIYRIVPDEGSS